MTKETMTVHKALAEKKILADRILSAINNGVYCIENKHSNNKIKGVTVNEFKGVIQGNYDKVDALIKRNNAICKAINKSNAVTNVKINDTEYTVAEAIYMKNYGMDYYKTLLDKMDDQYKKAQSKIQKENEKIDKELDEHITKIFGEKEGKVDVSGMDTVRKEFVKARTYDFVDPINVLDKINRLEEMIAAFASECDAALSVSNAITVIEIEY